MTLFTTLLLLHYYQIYFFFILTSNFFIGNSSKKASRRCSLPEPPIMSNPSSDPTNTKTPTHTSKTPKKFTVIKMMRRKDSTMLNNRNNNNTSNINVQRNSKTKKQKPSTPLMPSLTLLGIFAENQLTEATKQLEMRVKKRIPGRPQTVVVRFKIQICLRI